MAEPAYKYNEQDKVLCFHGPLIYEAKILKRTVDTDEPEPSALYRVHYQGWHKRYDEWVDDTRLHPITEETLALQRRLETYHASKKPARKSSKGVSSSIPNKRTRDDQEKDAEEADYLQSPEIRLDIPEPLKCQLVDDWENISKNQQLVPLPRSPSITQILAMYRTSKLEKKSIKEDPEILDEVIQGLCMYFNRALGTILLYRFERQQYAELRKKYPNKDMTDIYGAEHLLRLYVQLPKLLVHTSMEKQSVLLLTEYLHDVLQFVQKMQKEFFVSEYQNASPTYVTMAGEV
ncbi:MRG-domain-containing protein [Gongronella butleri]|nr:MRG-domain-containing protein [Gongronella butleri]